MKSSCGSKPMAPKVGAKSAGASMGAEKSVKNEAAMEGESVAEEKKEKASGIPDAAEDAQDIALKGRIGKQFKGRKSSADVDKMASDVKAIKAKRAAKASMKK